MEKIAILGASRGLGAALVTEALRAGAQVLAIARKPSPATKGATFLSADVATEFGQQQALEALSAQVPDRVFICVGGGPFGAFAAKKWMDHLWALQVSFLFPARVVHHLWSNQSQSQIILVGSSVAEASADPGAASYSAAKHALRGMFASLRAENPEADLRLFSPGYMDTDLLPKGAMVREMGVWSPKTVACDLWAWALSPDKGGHQVQAKHPS